MNDNVRTRFAPSPTGKLHIGALRTALFAWLVAQQNDGQFILRIEDTDKNREVDDAVQHIKDSLDWLGLHTDEGPDQDDKYGPYTQSERLDIYHKYAQILIDKGLAYADPTTPEQLKQWRKQAQAEKRPFHFRDHRPENPPEWDGSLPLRFRIDAETSPDWHDEIRGDIDGVNENIDDFVIIKTDGYPTYNFAHIIDDHLMKISHVIRGDEFISSMPKFLILQDALGFDRPKYAHVPPILAPTGNKKLSKRDGATDIFDYRDRGYLPATMMSFLATLGWNDGTEQEVFTEQELIEKFNLNRVQKSGARYDEQRLKWLNGQFIRNMPLDELSQAVKNHWPEQADTADDKYRQQVLALTQERLKFFAELPELTRFFFATPDYSNVEILDKKLRKKLDELTAKQWLELAATKLQLIEFNHDAIETELRELVDELDTSAGVLFKLLRVSVTGQWVAPGLFETIETIGKDEVLSRIKLATASL